MKRKIWQRKPRTVEQREPSNRQERDSIPLPKVQQLLSSVSTRLLKEEEMLPCIFHCEERMVHEICKYCNCNLNGFLTFFLESGLYYTWVHVVFLILAIPYIWLIAKTKEKRTLTKKLVCLWLWSEIWIIWWLKCLCCLLPHRHDVYCPHQ